MSTMSYLSKHVLLLAFLAIAYVCFTNASPIVQPNDVTPTAPPPPAPAKTECSCAKKPLTDPTTATSTSPLPDKTDKTIKTDKYHIYVEPIGNGKEAIIIPAEVMHGDRHKDVGTTTSPSAALIAAKKQAILNQSKTTYPDDGDWDTDLPRDHYRPHFTRFNDRSSNYL
ncbi:uncharacterized protein FA14DRAFT_6984 [Meira miltonrushii]|uniref:Uncharacterized protein n=1 Tax=Meira miltonrushii TaxID=1280837 RepID=A0A316VGZ4_9BASI|nr:uncharacterized protein FA14DRAFT_6984 [Meira miltonrushii]PWN36790.1 hypothetical protein FA14DRAFT_6984 [Meira miltonrushii]